MRKSILMGLGLAVSLAGAVAAQQPSDSAHARHRGEAGEWRGRGGPGGPMVGLLFKDITLTDAQKTQLKQMREADKAKFEATRDARKKEFEQVRAAREKGDTAAVRAFMTKNRQLMEQRRDQEFAAIRNVLTADQRVQFDKNVTELKAHAAERGFDRGGHRGGPGGERRGKPGDDRQG